MTDTIDLKLISKGDYSVTDTKPFSFDNKLLEYLPKFYTEKILGTEQYRMSKFLNITEDIFNIVYIKLKKIYETLDINIAHPRYVYQLGLLLGLSDLEDLTFSVDDDLIQKQRMYVKETADRLLLKGTAESIVRLFYGIAILVQLEELWTRDYDTFIANPDRFLKDFMLGIDYTGTFEDDNSYYAGYIYEDSYDLISEIETSLAETSGITKVTEYKTSDYAFNYIQTDNGLFYEDTSHLWFHYSENTTKFRIYDNKVFVKDGSDFKIFHHLTPDTTIFSISCVWFDIITINKIEYIILDTGSELQIRDILNYSVLGKVTKLNSNSINAFVNLRENVWLFFSETNYEYFGVDFSSITEPIIIKNPTSYSLSVPTGGYAVSLIEKIEDNSIYIHFINSSDIHKLSLFFEEDYSATTSYLKIATTLVDLVDLKKIDDSILFFLDKFGIGIYDYINNNMKYEQIFHDEDTYEYINFMITNNHAIRGSVPKHQITDSDNKVYLWKKNVSLNTYKPSSFYGLTFYDGKLFKSHYFNLKVSNIINNDNILSIKNLIETVKPAYTELKNIILEQDIETELISFSDILNMNFIDSHDLIFDGTQCVSAGVSGSHYFDGDQVADGSCDLFNYPLQYRASLQIDNQGGETALYYNGAEVYDGFNDIKLL